MTTVANFLPPREVPLGWREVRVSRQQFQDLALLAERQVSGLISEREYVRLAIEVCPRLKPDGIVNKLIVEDLPSGLEIFS